MDRGTLQTTVHGITKSWTRLSIWAQALTPPYSNSICASLPNEVLLFPKILLSPNYSRNFGVSLLVDVSVLRWISVSLGWFYSTWSLSSRGSSPRHALHSPGRPSHHPLHMPRPPLPPGHCWFCPSKSGKTSNCFSTVNPTFLPDSAGIPPPLGSYTWLFQCSSLPNTAESLVLNSFFYFYFFNLTYIPHDHLFKMCNSGTSLVVQWLKLCLPMQGVRVQSLVWQLKSHMPLNQKTRTWSRGNIVTNSIQTF